MAGLPDGAPAALARNAELLDAAELDLACTLLACGQAHLFEHWAPPGEDDEAKHKFFDQAAELDEAYPNGLAAYVARARTLLAASRTGANPLSGWTPTVPTAALCTTLSPGTEAYDKGPKSEFYRSLPSLKQLLLVQQSSPGVF